MFKHQYIDRKTSQIKTETLIQDQTIQFLYTHVREHAPTIFNALISSQMSSALGFINYDFSLPMLSRNILSTANAMGIDLEECVDSPETINTLRKLFERKIRYWETRPMPSQKDMVVSPSDSRILIGSFKDTSIFFIKEKFFNIEDLLEKRTWIDTFNKGDVAIFRLTPDKYHYNHSPVSGNVIDIYTIDGYYHSCNPGAVTAVETPYCKNKRVVTIIDTDVTDGTEIGKVAMVEVVALMIGQIAQCYSDTQYNDPQDVQKGLFLQKGQPKSLYRPGSSTNVLIFEPDRITFNDDLVKNQKNVTASSRFSQKWEIPLVETDLLVRSQIASKTE